MPGVAPCVLYLFWPEQERQKHLLAVFYALDICAAAGRAASSGIDLKSIISQDLKHILEGKAPQISTASYGEIWPRFQQALEAQGAAAVADYLQQLETQGAQRLNEARIIILGEKGAGKTCLARRLINPDAAMTTPQREYRRC